MAILIATETLVTVESFGDLARCLELFDTNTGITIG